MSDYIVAAKDGPAFIVIPKAGLDDDDKIMSKTEGVVVHTENETVSDAIPVLSITGHGAGYWDFYEVDDPKPKPEDLLEDIHDSLPDDPTSMVQQTTP
jgi:hypothetical protein